MAVRQTQDQLPAETRAAMHAPAEGVPEATPGQLMAGLEERLMSTLRALAEKQDAHARAMQTLQGDFTELQSSVDALRVNTAGSSSSVGFAALASQQHGTTAAGKSILASPPPLTNSPTSRMSSPGGCSTTSGFSAAASEGDDEASSPSPLPERPGGGLRRRSTLSNLLMSAYADDAQMQTWALVEGDPDVSKILSNTRSQIDEFAERTIRKQPKVADLEAEGTLYVQLLKARNLPAADANGKSDPYVKLSLGEQKQRSRTIRKTLDPVWQNEVFAFYGVLGQLVVEPLKMTFWDFDLTSSDDLLGHVDIDLGDHTYCNEIRRDMVADLDTTGEVVMQVWWEPEGEDDDDEALRNKRMQARRSGRGSPSMGEGKSWKYYVKYYGCYLVPRRMRTFSGACGACCIKVLHPESRFRSAWNVCLAMFILYCGIAVPLEIAFETDMVNAMCHDPDNPFGPPLFRDNCDDFLLWFWLNFIVDLWFMCDIYLNFRAPPDAAAPARLASQSPACTHGHVPVHVLVCCSP